MRGHLISLSSRMTVEQAMTSLRAVAPRMGKVIGKDIVDHIKSGKNIDGGSLHTPKRPRRHPIDPRGDKGGAGMDTLTMTNMIKSALAKFRIKRNGRTGMLVTFGTGSFPGSYINPIEKRSAKTYIHEYETKWAHGRIIGVSLTVRAEIVRKIRKAVKAVRVQ